MGLEAGGLQNLYLAGAGINAAAGAAGSYAQSNAQRQQGRYLKQTANEDAAMRDLQVKDVERQGDRAAAMRGKGTADLIGRQQAAAAGQGVDVGSGTAGAIQEDAAAFGAMDVEMEKNNAWRAAWGLRAEAANTRRAGKNAKNAADFNARMTAATGGLQFGRDALRAGYEYDQFRKEPLKSRYAKPPSGKNMSDPRNR